MEGGDCIHILNVIRVRVELWMLAKLFYVYQCAFQILKHPETVIFQQCAVTRTIVPTV